MHFRRFLHIQLTQFCMNCSLSLVQVFIDTTLVNILGNVLAELCQKEWEERDDDDIIIIERILLLIRNVLHVTNDPIKEQVCLHMCTV